MPLGKFKTNFVNSVIFSVTKFLFVSGLRSRASLTQIYSRTPSPLLFSFISSSALQCNPSFTQPLPPLFSFIPYSVHFQTAVAISSLLLTVSIWLLSPHASCSLGNSPCCPLPLTISFAALAGMASTLQTTGEIMRQDEHGLPRYLHRSIPTALHISVPMSPAELLLHCFPLNFALFYLLKSICAVQTVAHIKCA